MQPVNIDFDGDLDFRLPEITLDSLGVDAGDTAPVCRYLRPKIYRPRAADYVCYENAEQLAEAITPREGMRADAFVSGNFIFGDFIEAFMVKNKARTRELNITTLSLSQENVDSLAGLLECNYVRNLNLITSVYYWGHERRRMIPYIYEKLDIGDRFQLALADIHCKTCHFETLGGKKIVMHGSANLRSCLNIEQITIEENPELFEFYDNHLKNILNSNKTIDHKIQTLRGAKAWSIFSKYNFKD